MASKREPASAFTTGRLSKAANSGSHPIAPPSSDPDEAEQSAPESNIEPVREEVSYVSTPQRSDPEAYQPPSTTPVFLPPEPKALAQFTSRVDPKLLGRFKLIAGSRGGVQGGIDEAMRMYLKKYDK